MNIEYGKSKNYYGTSRIDSDFDRKAWRKNLIDLIVSLPAKEMFKHFPNHIALNEEDKFAWLIPNLELDDDTALIFKHSICTNYLKLIS